MNPFFRQILKVRPQVLNGIPERFITETDVKTAIDNGYVVDELTSDFLLKYKVIAEKYVEFIKQKNNVTGEELIYLLQHNELISDLLPFIKMTDYNDNQQKVIIDILRKNIDKLKYLKIDNIIKNTDLYYDYLDAYPNYLADIDYDFIKDYQKLYEIIKKHLNDFDVSKINLELFKVWYKNDPTILKNNLIPRLVYNDQEFVDIFINAFNNNEITLNDVNGFTFLGQKNIYSFLLNLDFANVIYLPNLYYHGDDCKLIIDMFLNNIDENFKYLPEVSQIVNVYDEEQQKKIIEAIFSKDLVVKGCDRSWSFLCENVDVMYHSFLKDQSVINDANFLINPNRRLTQDEINNMVDIIKNNKVIVDKFTKFIISYPQINSVVLANNPYIIDGSSMWGDINLKELVKNGYEVNVSSPAIIFIESLNANFDIIVEALDKNISLLNNPNFNIDCSNDEKMLRVYNILNAHNYLLTPDSPKCLFENYLLVLKSLEGKTITLNDISDISISRSSTTYAGMLRQYLIGNYNVEELESIIPDMAHIDRVGTINADEVKINNIIIALRNDFANCIHYKEKIELSTEVYQKISDLYFANYEQNRQFYGKKYPLIDNNPYINLYECLNYHHNMVNINCLSYECREYFITNYKNAGVEIKGNLIKIFKYDDLVEVVKENPDKIDEWTLILKEWKDFLPSEFVSAVCECITEGTYVIKKSIPSVLAVNILDFAISNNVANIGIIIKNAMSNSYSVDDNIKGYIYDVLINKKATAKEIGYKNAFVLEINQLIEIFKANPENMIMLNSEFVRRSKKIIELKNNPEFQEIREAAIKNYDYLDFEKAEKKEYSLDELLILGTKNPTILLANGAIFERFLSLDSETYNKFRGLIIEAYKKGEIKLNNNINRNYILIHKDNGEIDEEFMDYILQNDLNDYIKCLNNNLPEIYRQKLYEAFDKLGSIEEKIKYFNKNSFEHIYGTIYKNLLVRIFDAKHIINYAYKNIFTEQELYNYWLEAGCPLDDIAQENDIFNNKLIILYALKQDLNNCKYFNYEPKNDERDWKFEYQVFEIFNAQNSISAFTSNLFYNNSYIWHRNELMKTFVITDNNMYSLFDDDYNLPVELMVTSLKNFLYSLNVFVSAENISEVCDYLRKINFVLDDIFSNYVKGNWEIFKVSLENDFNKTIMYYNCLRDVTPEVNEYLINKAIKSNYIASEKTPKFLLQSKEFLFNSIKLSPQSIMYFESGIEFNDEEKTYIRDFLVSNEIYYYLGIFNFLESDYGYVKLSIIHDPSKLEIINDLYLSFLQKNELIQIVKNKILDGSYNLNERLPVWLFYDEELLSLLMENPNLLKKYNNLDYTLDEYKMLYDKGISVNNNPYTILNNIINNISLIEVLDINSQLVYPQELIDKLIDKLINSHYIVSERTPQILLYDIRFITYALENNMKVDDKYIERIIDFEKIYEYQNFDLVKKYCLLGYGKKYQNYFNKFGVDETLKLAMKYGYLLSLIDLNINYEITDINDILTSFMYKDHNYLIDILIRTGYQLSDDEITNRNYGYSLALNDKLFKYLLKENPDKIVLYEGNNFEIFKLAIENGYVLTPQKYKETKTFNNNDYITKMVLDIDFNCIKYYRGNNPEIFNYAIDKGFVVSEQDFIDHPYLCNTYLLEMLISSPEVNKYILFYNGKDEKIFEKALLHGYVPTIADLEKKNNFCSSTLIIRQAMQEDINAIKYYSAFDLDAFKDLFDLVDKNGHKIIPDRETIEKLKFIHSDINLMKKAILYDCNNIIFYEGNDQSLYELALAQGYIPKKEDFEVTDYLNNKDIIFKKIIEMKNIDLLLYYMGSNEEIIKEIYITLLKEQYNLVIRNDDDLKNYISVWQSFNTSIMHERLLTYMNFDNINAFKMMPIDYYLVLKYGINNSKMDFLIQIIKEGNIGEFANVYTYLVNNYLELNNNAFGVDLFLKVARLYINYSNLVKNLVNSKLSEIQKTNLIKILNSDVVVRNVNNLEDLEKLDEDMVMTIKSKLDSCTDPKEIKDMILEYVFNINYEEFKHILTNYINFDTLDKILAKAEKLSNQDELFSEASMLKVMLKMLEETVNATNDLESLKIILRNYIENKELVDKVRPLFYDLKERIRNVYELDANATLTDVSNLSPNENGVIDLQNSEYTIYAHVMSGNNFEEYVNYRFNGRVTICVSPISNLGKKLYSNSGIILGFTKVPRGGFIGSSNVNMGSNSYINDNDYQVYYDRYYHLEIKDSSSLTPRNHPETLLYRDGLLPSCIIIRGDVPSDEEKKAQQAFKDLGLDIPFVHTQAIGNVAELKGNNVTVVDPQEEVEKGVFVQKNIELGEYQAKLEKIKQVRDKVLELRRQVADLKIEQDEVYDLIPMKIGGSHDMFKCHIKGKDGVFYLKPGYRKGGGAIDPYRSYAMQASYRIQSIVNPEGAVYVDVVKVPFENLGYSKGVSEDNELLCSVIEVLPETTSYDGWYKNSNEYVPLTEKEMSLFIQEFISDYLLFSYDTKAENFLKDKNGLTYGIDKEQALKFILNPLFVSRDEDNNLTFDTSFITSTSPMADFNHCGIIYNKIFDAVMKGQQEITEANITKVMDAINRIECISDEDYKEIFKNYIDEFVKSNVVRREVETYKNSGLDETQAMEAVKNDLYSSLLARKNNLRKEFTLYITQVLNEYYSKIGKDVPEWVINLNQEKRI